MKRKLIKQGGYGVTFYVPKKWVDARQLKAGDEIEVTTVEDSLLLSSTSVARKKRILTFSLQETRESALRTLLVNAYRAGFDEIHLSYSGKKEDVHNVVSSFLLGFDVFSEKDNTYILKSISEPGNESFEQIFQRLFYIIEEILKSFSQSDKANIRELVEKVQSYDNFLKRCLARDISRQTSHFFLWQLLSSLAQIARVCYHFHNDILRQKKKIPGSSLTPSFLFLQKMFAVLKDSFFQKDFIILVQLHTLDTQFQKEKAKICAKLPPDLFGQVMLISRLIYITNSPLAGYLQLRSYNEGYK